MKKLTLIGAFVIGATSVATVAGVWHAIVRSESNRKEDVLRARTTDGTFCATSIEALPAHAQRYLLHAITDGSPIYTRGRIEMTGRLPPAPGANPIEVRATEILTPEVGFVWSARARMMGIPLRIQDHYTNGEGAVSVRLLGVVPLQRGTNPDITLSSLGRLHGEAVWVPTSLLPTSGARWKAVDDRRAEVTRVVDGYERTLTLEIDDDGRLMSISMMRHGDVGIDGFRDIPYGFEVLEEGTFGTITIPTRIRGGWWYGTSRYVESDAAEFVVEGASFE